MRKAFSLQLIIVILLLTAVFIPTNTAQNNTLLQNENLRLFNFKTTTEIEIEDTDELKNPILPGTTLETNLLIKFKLEQPPLFPTFLFNTKIGNWIMFRDAEQNMNAEIKLTVESPGEWCTVKLEKDTITIQNYTTEYIDPVKAKINITIKPEATALTTGTIKITANFTSKEKWGLNSSGDTAEKTITVDYQPDIKIEIENQTIKITPTKTTYMPINITNNGNGKTTVKSVIKNIPKNWTISFNESDTELEIGETKELLLNVTSIKDFDNETIELEFTPQLTENSKYKGNTISLHIRLENDGSLEDEAVDTTLLIVILVAILLIIIIAWILFRKR